jgi:hypothetical protein
MTWVMNVGGGDDGFGKFSRVKLLGNVRTKPLKAVAFPYPTMVPELLIPSAWVKVGFNGSTMLVKV